VSSAIITANPEDKIRSIRSHDTPIEYIPWPTHLTLDEFDIKVDREPMGVFVGRLSEHKNIDELVSIVPTVLENTPIERFAIVGDGKLQSRIDDLTTRYKRIEYNQSLPREQVLQLIARSAFTLSTASFGSWGLLVNSWAVGTPIISINKHFGLEDRQNCLLTDSTSVHDAVSLLYTDDELYERLQSNGWDRFQDHRSERVGEQYANLCERIVNENI
jgi:glycosyltransferase involved in cell wall biosynthesis